MKIFPATSVADTAYVFGPFPLGTTTVTCTATDADDTPGTVSAAFTVTVNDTDLALGGVPADITANNTVFSYNVADATIKFSGKGAVSETQRKGWFTRVWEKVTPF